MIPADLPVVFVHGWMFDARVWAASAGRCAPTRAAATIDLPGYGSKVNDSMADLAGTAAAMQRVVTGPAVCVALSLGGLIALRIAAAVPERVAALVLVAATPRFLTAGDWPHAVPASDHNRMAQRLAGDIESVQRRFAMLTARADASEPEVRAVLEQIARTPPRPAITTLRAGLAMLAQADLRREFTRLTCPLALIMGDRDPLLPIGAAAAMSALNPGLRVQVIAGAAHAPFLSQPRAFSDHLSGFLSTAA